MNNWFPLSKIGKSLLALIVASLVICYGPWSWHEPAGTVGVLFYTQVVLLVVTPLLATWLMSRVPDSKEQKKGDGQS
ncbi:hypothetical protein LJC26_03835 [Desulfovibrio sp. OttesenSCG-928-O18]|nr:hypothetical protein [Desulfovibrio sp. OttesenSCG-928-O18]